jgi:hypothetical protein
VFKWLCRLGFHRWEFNSYGSIPTEVTTCTRCGLEYVYCPADD